MNALSYTLRTNINLTIVAMVKDDDNSKKSNENFYSVCPKIEDRYSSRHLKNINKNSTLNSLTISSSTSATTAVKTSTSSSSSSSTPFSIISSLFSSRNEPNIISTDDNASGDDNNLFDWSESLQGTIVGAYYYGYILTNFNGGQLSEWMGTKRLLTIATTLASFFTLIVPFCAYTHPWLLIIARILTGLAQGVVTPSIYQLLSYWIPRNELGTAFGLIPASGYIGAVITMPICAFLSEYGFFGGWPSAFYVFGTISLFSLIPWLLFVYNCPDVHPTITSEELNFIQSTSMSNKTKKNMKQKSKSWVPWCSILSSRKIWAITITKFCTSWGNLFLMSKLPTYLSQVLNMPITYNSYVNASIYIALGGSYLSWGSVADWVERRQCLGRTASRKLFQTIALLGSAAFMAAIPFIGCDVIPIIIMLNLSMVTLGLTAGGDSLIIVDVAPDYSGSIYGFSNSIGSLPGFLAPLFVGVMLDRPNTNPMHQWSLLFWIGAMIYVLGALIFLIFVNSNPESWGRHPSKSYSVKDQQQQNKQKQVDFELGIEIEKKQSTKTKIDANKEKDAKRSSSRLSESDILSNATTASNSSSGCCSTISNCTITSDSSATNLTLVTDSQNQVPKV